MLYNFELSTAIKNRRVLELVVRVVPVYETFVIKDNVERGLSIVESTIIFEHVENVNVFEQYCDMLSQSEHITVDSFIRLV